METYEYVGAIHLHTKYSDGTSSMDEVIAYAQELGLDFVMFSDHNTLKPLHEGKQGYYGNLLAIVGCELDDYKNVNHYLAFGIDEVPKTKDPMEYVAIVREAGGLGIIAHPDESQSFRLIHTPLPWTRWDVDGFDAIEVWNYMSQWIVGMRIWNILPRIISPDRAIMRGPSRGALEIWDKANVKRHVTGIGSLDLHGVKVGPVQIIPYKAILSSILTHILLDSPLSMDDKKDINMIFQALKDGKAFFANERLGKARGIRFWAVWDGGMVGIGGEAEWRPGMRLVVHSPLPAHVELFRNGDIFAGGDIKEPGIPFDLEAPGPGSYRAVFKREGKGWAYTNNIFLKGEEEA
jgi:hypothetical protein